MMCWKCDAEARYRVLYKGCGEAVCHKHLGDTIDEYLGYGEVEIREIAPRCSFCDEPAVYEVPTKDYSPLYVCEKHRYLSAEVILEGTPILLDFPLAVRRMR